MHFILTANDSSYWAERYIEYDYVKSHKYAKILLNLPCDDVEKVSDKKDELEIELKPLKDKYGVSFYKSENWAGKSLREMAKAIDIKTGNSHRQRQYDIWYRQWCDASHGNILSSKKYTEFKEGDQAFRVIEKKDYDVASELSAVFVFLIDINRVINQQFNLGMNDEIETLEKDYLGAQKGR